MFMMCLLEIYHHHLGNKGQGNRRHYKTWNSGCKIEVASEGQGRYLQLTVFQG